MSINTTEIARLCNVSRGTVDRALNNRQGISEETKQRILEVAKEHGYTPHLLASSLATGRTHSIGVVVFDLNNRHFTQLVSAAEQALLARGFFTYVCMSEKDPSQELRIVADLHARKVDGILLISVNNQRDYADYLLKLSTPIVSVTNFISDQLHFVGGENRSAAQCGVLRLRDVGYRRVYFVCPPFSKRHTENAYAQVERAQGYLEAMKSCPELTGGIIDTPDYVERFQKLVREPGDRIGFFCSSDLYALAIYQQALLSGMRIPRDFGLMGFDSVDILNYIPTRLSTVYYPAKEIGKAAANALVSLIDQEQPEPHQLIGCPLVEGETI